MTGPRKHHSQDITGWQGIRLRTPLDRPMWSISQLYARFLQSLSSPNEITAHAGRSTLHMRFQEPSRHIQIPDSIVEQRRLNGGTQKPSRETEQRKTQKPEEMGTQYLCQGLSIRIGEQFQYGAVPLR